MKIEGQQLQRKRVRGHEGEKKNNALSATKFLLADPARIMEAEHSRYVRIKGAVLIQLSNYQTILND